MSYKELAQKYAQNNPSLFLNPVLPYIPELDRNLIHYSSYAFPPSMMGLQPSEYTGWRDEELSWHNTCYIHSGLSPYPFSRLWGPDHLKFLKKYVANSFENFAIGKAKHAIMCNENGNDMIDGMLLKTGEQEYLTNLGLYIPYLINISGMDVHFEGNPEDSFLFQLGGPTSLQIVEAASGDDLHDIQFMAHRMSKICGKDVRILRMGMAGSLAYEVHGKIEDSHVVYDQLIKAGKKYGLRRLGVTAYNMTHWENGFTQMGIDFLPAWYEEEGFSQVVKSMGMDKLFGMDALSGSMGQDVSLRYRNPIEVGWEKTINFDHDFVGKEALQKILAGPHRKMVTLEWNKEDILDIHRSQFTPGEEAYQDISQPDDFSYAYRSYHADQVLNKNGECIGISTGRMSSWYYRTMISICSIDMEYAEIGREVYVLWGEPGTRQKKIRALVARWPYFNTDRNQKVDVSKIPQGTMD